MFKMQIFDNTLQQIKYDSGELANGQSVIFEWPSDDYQPNITAISGVGVSSSVRGILIEVVH